MSEGEEYKGHVVVVAYPSQGHINPLLQFAKRLSSKAVKATLATPPYIFTSISSSLGVHVEPISDGFDQGGFKQAKNESMYIESFKVNGSRTLSQLIQRHKDSDVPVNCVVYDSFLPWALDVAKQHNIYGAAFSTNSVADNIIFCLIKRGLLNLPVGFVDDDNPLVVPGLPPLKIQDLPTFVANPESYPAYLAVKLGQYSNIDLADWVFCNSLEELEPEEARSLSELLPVKMIGPMVPSYYLDGRIRYDYGYGASLWKPLSEECIKWLETKPQKSVVYVSFGSMVSLTEEQMGELAWGLKESNFYFLWVVRESESQKFPLWFAEIISNNGNENDGKGLVVPWCNQLELLSQEAIGCFVTHCGWNSTLEGLSLGVPMVGMPQWADQSIDAKYVGEVWKVGIRANADKSGVVRREEVLRCLNDVMVSGERSGVIRRNSSKWRRKCVEAISEGGSSDRSINEFVEHLQKQVRS